VIARPVESRRQKPAAVAPPLDEQRPPAPAPATLSKKRKAPPQCKPASTRRERRADQASRLRHGRERSSYRGELEQRERFAAWVEKTYGAKMDHIQRTTLAREIRMLPPRVFRGSWAIVGDNTGEAARVAWLGKPAVWRAKMLRAALRIIGGVAHSKFDGSGPRAFRARRICALAWALSELTWKGSTSKKWSGGFVAGVTQGALCQLLRDQSESDEDLAVPSLSTLTGLRREDGSLANGQIGYLQALREVDFLYWQRLPAAFALPCERWGSIYKSGRTVDKVSSRYWLCARAMERAAAADPWIPALLECVSNWARDGLKVALERLYALPPPLPPLAA
jgi:hypothetical protein